jgi:hypothetical protein
LVVLVAKPVVLATEAIEDVSLLIESHS